jgi:GTP-binding protein
MFIDEVTIKIKAGNGGPGAVSFRHDKYEPRGGPDGGDGGDGGSVLMRVDTNLKTLLDLRYNKHYAAENGGRGLGKNMHGKNGRSLVIKVPAGTMVYDHDTRERVADLTRNNEEFTAAAGGMGGRGNTRFKSATNRAPRHAQPGVAGGERVLDLKLKLIADVGLVGKPNAGKSTLLARVSAARPKIADYPFTTLEPNLGIVKIGDYGQFVMADIPGIIEGAHQGKGLGDEFLKHIERTRVLVFMAEATAADLEAEFEMLDNELKLYSEILREKPRILCVTKTDLVGTRKKFGDKYVPISSVTGRGMERLLAEIQKKL